MQDYIYEQDYSLKELPQTIKELLQNANLPWLNSFEFCLGYVPNPAERVLLRMKGGNIHQVVFYRLIKRMGFLRTIEVIGFPNIVKQDIQGLFKTHKAYLATLNHLEQPVKPDENWCSTHANVYCHTYVTIAKLPTSKDEYLNLLGKNRKRQLPQYLRKVNRYFENPIEIRYESAKEIKFEDVIQLECLNRKRRAGKGKGVDSICDIQDRQQRRWHLTESLGLLVTLRYQGNIIGGTLNYIYGNEALMIVVAHDTQYDHLRLGHMSIWKTMEHLIDKGISECNLLWGRKEFKTQFLGVEYPWSVHIISLYPLLAIVWKIQICFNAFYMRAWRLLMTRVGVN